MEAPTLATGLASFGRGLVRPARSGPARGRAGGRDGRPRRRAGHGPGPPRPGRRGARAARPARGREVAPGPRHHLGGTRGGLGGPDGRGLSRHADGPLRPVGAPARRGTGRRHPGGPRVVALARLRCSGADGPLLVAIDDAHRLDELSMAMAATCCAAPTCLVVVTTRPGVDVPGAARRRARGKAGRPSSTWRRSTAATSRPWPPRPTAPPLAPASLATLVARHRRQPALRAGAAARRASPGSDPRSRSPRSWPLRMAELPPGQRGCSSCWPWAEASTSARRGGWSATRPLLAAEQAGSRPGHRRGEPGPRGA